jgi:hypothetical protein
MNREQAIRSAFYDQIKNALSIDNVIVPVFDNKSDGGYKIYVLIQNQTATDDYDFNSFRYNCTIELCIVHKQDDSYTRDIVDLICDQIESAIFPNSRNSSVFTLPVQTGWQFTNVKVGNVQYADLKTSATETVAMKFITFNLKTIKS